MDAGQAASHAREVTDTGMTEYILRFIVGGAIVSAFATLGDMLRQPRAPRQGEGRP